jgi:peroxiredoxin
MKRSVFIPSVVVLGFLSLMLAVDLTARAANDPASLKGKAAPAIALKTLDGKDLSLADQKGKVVLVDTWATWCPPCKASLPHIQAIATDKARAEKGLVVWAVNDQETKAVVEKFMQDNKYSFTVLMDTKAEMLKAYFITGIPTTVIIGRDGTVKDVFVGYAGEATAKEIDAAVAKALAEPAPK